jgi:phenylalanyl-tRNA synthetase beta chain
MKISLEWLSQYLPGPLDAQTAADALTSGGLPVETVEQLDGDTVLDVEVTSNRSDCLCVVGVARELAALLAREFVDVPASASPASPTPAGGAAGAGLQGLRIESSHLCPFYSARILRNLTIGPSPDWMQRRLRAVGLRPINNIVDVTNYVMFEMGQPLHAFDFDKLAGPEIVVRNAAAGEKLVSLDGHERTLAPGMLVIADARKPVALAGVMGGRDSEVTPLTRNILLESARFEPLCIRTTARALAMGSDSSYRYERGLDPALAPRASQRATQLMLETAGGHADGPLLAAGPVADAPRQLWLRLPRLRQVLGIDFPAHAVVDALTRLRLCPVLRGERVDVTIPTYRLDLTSEIDLVEEVARVVGYDKVPVRDEIRITVAPVDPVLAAQNTIRSTLVAAGYFEAITFTFGAGPVVDAFQPPGTSQTRIDPRVRKQAGLRPSIIPGLLLSVSLNELQGTPGARLFEIGSVFWSDPAAKVQEKRTLALSGGSDYRAVRGAVEAVLRKLDANRPIDVKPAPAPGFAVAAAGAVHWGEMHVGYIGRIDRALADLLSLREPPIAAELDLEPLLAGAVAVPQLQPLPRFPAVRRDLSLIVSESTPYAQLQSLIDTARPANLETVEYVTTYRGKPLEPGSKSVTITLVFRSAQTTLTSETVEAAVQKLIALAKEKLGATLRT